MVAGRRQLFVVRTYGPSTLARLGVNTPTYACPGMTPNAGYILAIENSNPSSGRADTEDSVTDGPSVAVARIGGLHQSQQAEERKATFSAIEVISSENIRVVTRNRDDLIPAIDRVIHAANVRTIDLSMVAVSVGPGGYTAVRSACSAGKLIAEAVGARCVCVPSAFVAALAAHDDGLHGTIAVCLAGKDDSTHATRFELTNQSEEIVSSSREIGLIRANDLDDLEVSALIADRFLPEPLQRHAHKLGVRIIPPRFNAAACARLSWLFPLCDPIELNPIYPREPDAVTLWRAKRGA